ncbi:hypothetical protein PF003_g14026 [Phytophthora fragariae]|nr:hypothetical protein PF003_g14026 [Phytophthora fragariae]
MLPPPSRVSVFGTSVVEHDPFTKRSRTVRGEGLLKKVVLSRHMLVFLRILW